MLLRKIYNLSELQLTGEYESPWKYIMEIYSWRMEL